MELREVRQKIYEYVKEELLGPGSEQTGSNIENEIITDMPSKRYVTGILFNKSNEIIEEGINTSSEDDIEGIIEYNGQDEEIEELKKSMIKNNNDYKFISDYDDIDEEYYEEMNNAHIIRKSSMGLTFYIDRDIQEILINLKGARYKEVKINDCMIAYDGDLTPLQDKDIKSYIFYEDGMLRLNQRLDNKVMKHWEGIGLFSGRDDFKNKVYKLLNQCSTFRKAYKRYPVKFDNPYIVEFNDKNQGKLNLKEEKLKLFALKRKYRDKFSITIMLINENDVAREENYLFQPKIIINSKENKFKFLSSNNLEFSINPELDLLYRNKKSYGIGHGVSVDYLNIDTITGEGYINTTYLPIYEVPNTNFEVDKVDEFDILSMYNLSDLSSIDKSNIINGLNKFIDNYEYWINEIKKEGDILEENLLEAFNHNVKNCNIVKERMREGVEFLCKDNKVYKAFQLANKAMYIQRIQSTYKKEVNSEQGFDVYKKFDTNSCRWRGFQLAFLLMIISSISDKKNKYRDIVDLIWIPTGGGKTEAYLGVAAFTIFHRRLNSNEDGAGTTIIMRYTLRLLAAQQFERACKLICACEYIRKEDTSYLGEEEISIGLWIGSEQTPNSLKEAKVALDKLQTEKYANNKFQLLKCPWCGEELTKSDKNINGVWGYYCISRGRNQKFQFRCPNEECYFTEELPIQVVDECLYKNPPTLLFSTVDKFAMLPWKGEAISFFKYKQCDPPELIIQDELHLISGPLGTLVGLFETAIDYLCTKDGIKPKIISSTATICEADEQVKNLYNRNTLQFPPPGINIEDSFFTKEEDINKKPGRMYVGVCGVGQTQITTEIRLFASILQKVSQLNLPNEILDKYWTLISYFNSIRELGKALTLVDDDVKDYMIRIASRTGNITDTRKIYSALELTSRNSSYQIVKILNELENRYPNNPINMLLATNMISVGVDVPRLNVMTVIGQPKLTSEYIQASSRVGRADPGLVFTLYDGRKSRDESHYEIFQSYHQAFYKYVEPTSITPFSEPALERMLHSVFITMVRHKIDILNSEEAAYYFDDKDNEIFKIKEYILNRAYSIGIKETDLVLRILDNIIEKWNYKKQIEEVTLKYSKGDNPLMNRFYEKVSGHKGFDTMTSMRNVDGELYIKVLKRESEK